MSTPQPPPSSPSLSLPWRFSSSLIMGLTGSISRGFLYGLNRMEVIGLDRFLETLDQRKDVEGRERGLITGTISRWEATNWEMC
jgi:monolysocardiolipin acyltransferase